MKNDRVISLAQKIGLVLLAICCLAIFLEVSVRFVDKFAGRGFLGEHRYFLAKRDGAPLLPFRTFGHKLYHDDGAQRFILSRYRQAYPFKKEANTIRIVCFGGSTTENKPAYLKAGLHYPLVLQNKLNEHFKDKNFEVINMGFSAYSTAHSLILFELNVLSWDPDIVILSHNFNDLMAMYWPDFTFDYSHKYSSEVYLPPRVKRPHFLDVNLRHSRLYWYVKGKIRRIKSQLRRNRADTIKRISYGPEPTARAQEVFVRNIKSFVHLARANDIKVILASQPIETSEEYFIKHMAHKRYNSIIKYPLHEEFHAHHRRFNELLASAAQELDVPFIDNNKALGTKREYFEDFVHYTPAGIEQLAENYADFLIGYLEGQAHP